MVTTIKEVKYESVRIKRIVLDLHENRQRRDLKHESYLLNTKRDNVQNLSDA